jgi:hypothetical protein
MLRIEAYFNSHAEGGGDSFGPLPTREVNELIRGSISHTSAELKEIVAIFNKTTEQTQTTGTGWFYVRLHLTGLIRANGMEFAFERQSLRLLK